MKKVHLGLFPNDKNAEALAELEHIAEWTESLPICFHLPTPWAEKYHIAAFDPENLESMADLDIAVSLGGDGTFLRMAQQIAPLSIPALGINFGRLGFLTEIERSRTFEALQSIVAGSYQLEEHSMLQAVVTAEDGSVKTSCHALNDIVISRGHRARMTKLKLKIEGKPAGNYPADGLIIATATGSTAYSLSAGGPIVYPGLEATVLTPICAHALHTRPLVIPMSAQVEVSVLPPCEEIVLSSDGVIVCDITEQDAITVTQGKYKIKFIKINPLSYYETWQNKLLRAEETVKF